MLFNIVPDGAIKKYTCQTDKRQKKKVKTDESAIHNIEGKYITQVNIFKYLEDSMKSQHQKYKPRCTKESTKLKL